MEEACLLLSLPSPPAGGCSVEQGEVPLLARLEEGEILCGKEKEMYPHYTVYMCEHAFMYLCSISILLLTLIIYQI